MIGISQCFFGLTYLGMVDIRVCLPVLAGGNGCKKAGRLTLKAGSSKHGKASRAPDVSNWVVANVAFVPSPAAVSSLVGLVTQA